MRSARPAIDNDDPGRCGEEEGLGAVGCGRAGPACAEQGLSLSGPDGLLNPLTKAALETSFNEE